MSSEKLPDQQTLYSETLAHKNLNGTNNAIDRLIDNYIYLYLHDDILVKIYRASMMNSVEVRSPFLDKAIASFICQ